MRISSKRIAGIVALVILGTVGQALAGPIGDTGSFTWTRQAGYYAGNGGEFTLSSLSGLSNASYVGNSNDLLAAKNIGSVDPSFQTFCLETNSYAVSPSYFVINSGAVMGGAGGAVNGFDAISKGTAWLYSQFATGALNVAGGNYFSLTAPARSVEAGRLQNAIWMLEGEAVGAYASSWNATNPYYVAALANGGVTSAAPGYLGVYVLNNYTNRAHTALAQDFLYYSVPDGGATLMLLGGALMGLGALRRKLS